tara:strand:+ start:451 stop:708 length:258 start_codon:yes stop_codon:yes gene_type:complete
MADEKRKSYIKKKITRNLNTAQFEQLEVSCEFQEDVEWSNIAERQDKSDKITKLLIIDFQQTLDQVLQELELHEKRATLKRMKQR